MEYAKIDFFLDLFNSGYENAYVSIIESFPHDDSLTRIEIILPNVGRLIMNQTFVETDNDEQIPSFDIDYETFDKPNVLTKLNNRVLITKAINIVYKTKKFFEMHPEYKSGQNDKTIINRIIENRKIAQKMYTESIKQRNKFIFFDINQK